MLKLIKYEFMKKYKAISMVLITAIALNILAITRGAGGSIIFIPLSITALSILYLVDIIKMYSEDINKKTGYMLFMTPNSGYKIITSKLLTAVIEGLGLVLVNFLIVVVNGFYIIISTGTEINYNQGINAVNRLLAGNFGINLGQIFVFLLAILTFLIAFITTVYTSITIRKSIFSEIKFGGLLSFIIFLLINWGISSVSSKFFDIITPYYEHMNNTITNIYPESLAMILLPMILISIVQIVVLAGFSGYLLEKKINL